MIHKIIPVLFVSFFLLFSVSCNKKVSSQSNQPVRSSAILSNTEGVSVGQPSTENPFSLSEQIPVRKRLSSGYLRSTIEEKLPEKEKRPFLKFLNEGRAVSDQAMRLIADGKYDEFYKSTSESFKSQYSQEQFNLLIGFFEKSAGKITHYEFRNQAYELPVGVALSADLSQATSSSYYSIKTSNVESEGFFMQVETMVENGKPVVSFITTQNYGSRMPKYLIKTDRQTLQK